MFERLFVAHPRSVGETYVEHMLIAGRIGLLLIGGGIACLLHALLPNLHMRTGSRLIHRLHAELSGRQPTAAELDGAIIYEI